MTVLNKSYLKFAVTLIFCSIMGQTIYADYPKPLEERKRDQMGSILGSDGIDLNFHKSENAQSSKVAHTSKPTKKEGVNYVWLAALENVKYMPLNSADYNGGIIITDWINNDKRSTHRFKVSIYIKSNIVSTNSFEVNIYSEEFKRGHWIADRSQQELLKTKMTNDILSRAKELQSQGKRN